MLLALLLFLAPLPQAASAEDAAPDTPAELPLITGTPTEKPAVSPRQSEPAAPVLNLAVDEPAPQAKGVSYLPGKLVPQPVVRAAEELSSTGTIEPRRSDLSALPASPAFRRQIETPAQHRAWLALAFAGHGAAAFDAWSTRRAIVQGHCKEQNPLLRPFANSNALYVAVQASPALMDYLGHRMMTSRRRWVRRVWWLPQSAGTAVSLASGIYNLRHVP